MLWLEEPTIPDDFVGTARVGREGGIAVAGGENLHTLDEFAHAIRLGAIDYPQPDASNIGGVTGWLKVRASFIDSRLPAFVYLCLDGPSVALTNAPEADNC